VEKKEDGAFVAKVPAMPGCIGQGKTTQEALENVRQAMILFIEDCRRSGKDIPREPDR
jgi:predicted RNase H-like HicB family nuclease